MVLAAGYWSRSLLAQLGVRVPLESAAGYSITTDGAGAPAHPLKLIEADVAVTPFADGLRLAGRFALGSAPRAVSARQIRHIVEAARPYLRDWRPGHTRFEQVGLRPVTPDSLPIIGEPHGLRGLVIAIGHGMLGLTLAPGTAAEVAAPGRGGRAYGEWRGVPPQPVPVSALRRQAGSATTPSSAGEASRSFCGRTRTV